MVSNNTEKYTIYVITENTPGYSPEGDPVVVISEAQAIDALKILATDAIDAWYQDVECACDDGELCDPCSLTAQVDAIIADGDYRTADPDHFTFTLHPPCRLLGTAFTAQLRVLARSTILRHYGRDALDALDID